MKATGGLAQSLALRIPPIRRLHASRNTLLAEREALIRKVTAQQSQSGDRSSVFYHYNSCFVQPLGGGAVEPAPFGMQSGGRPCRPP